ncbi:AraC family transcriptional regulator [Deinococcus roseus]|uniref:AraC family transcriptional regulator n=1 Tax=Deinococcus roseus TaxID=392414 RepID=A0ABQ2CXM0_9DEIO|nr:AraC family transcriptional regulator [Deinococcus roseus]GGJ27132.1 AraC family transcriptional regulator [Deinococcus roseus]
MNYTSGYFCWLGQPGIADHLHRHSDIELNLVCSGALTYLMGGTMQVLREGDLAIFWAITPHRIVQLQPETTLGVVHIPLTDFLRWALPQSLLNPVMHGELVLHRGIPALDMLLFERWSKEARELPRYQREPTEQSEMHQIVYLELQARLRRAAHDLNRAPEKTSTARTQTEDFTRVEEMATFVSSHYTDPLTVEDIAQGVKLHPNYAMSLFKRTMGLTLLEYLTQHRLAHAQRLLITSNCSILDVALEAGFGSLSRFYAVFKTEVGISPRQYRNQRST